MATLKQRLRACEAFDALMEERKLDYRLVTFEGGTFGIEDEVDCQYEIEIKDTVVASRVALAWVDGVVWLDTIMLFAQHFAEDEEQHAAAVRNAVLQRAREKEDGRKHH